MSNTVAPQKQEHGGAPPPVGADKAPKQTGVWGDSFCNVFSDPALCCIAYYLPFVTYGQNAEMLGYDCVWHGIINMIPFVNCVYGAKQREEIRNMRGIPGSFTKDCCTVFWFWCCALIQHSKELRAMQQEMKEEPPQQTMERTYDEAPPYNQEPEPEPMKK